MDKVVAVLLLSGLLPAFSLKEFSLARFSDSLVYANNSVIDVNLIGEGTATDGGALECHTDDTNCCRSTDGMAGGEWYGPDGNVIIAGNQIGIDSGLYRTRDHMMIRLNRRGVASTIPSGLYRCEIPGPGGVTITRYITLTFNDGLCSDLPSLNNGSITYTPPRVLSAILPAGQRYQGTIATYSCSSGYQLLRGPTQRACVGGTWNGTQPLCERTANPDSGQTTTTAQAPTTPPQTTTNPPPVQPTDLDVSTQSTTQQVVDCGPLTAPTNGQVDTSSGTTFGSTATYTCDPLTRTCGPDGSWTPQEPNCPNSSLSSVGSGCSEVSGIVGGVIAVVWFLISILIIASMAVYILYLKKNQAGKQHQMSAETVGGGSAPEYEVMEGGGAEYEEIDKVKEKMGQPHPPKGDYELSQCAAYGPVNTDTA